MLTKNEIEDGLHAFTETSLMLALKPELVGDERPNESAGGQIPEGWSLEEMSMPGLLTTSVNQGL